MKLAKVGAWMDKKISGAQTAWKNSDTKKAVDSAVVKTKQAVIDTKDKVCIAADKAGDNFDANMEVVNKKSEGKGFFNKAFNVGMQGGLLGMTMKKPEEAKAEEKPTAPPKPQQTDAKPVEQHDGWNIAS